MNVVTTFETVGPGGRVWQTSDADRAEAWSRAGARVTACTRCGQ
jgi:hypothetical protein